MKGVWTYQPGPECTCGQPVHEQWCPLAIWLNRRLWELEQLSTPAERANNVQSPKDLDKYCNTTPEGRDWPVCSLDKDHPGDRHESADFWWVEGGPPFLKPVQPRPPVLTADAWRRGVESVISGFGGAAGLLAQGPRVGPEEPWPMWERRMVRRQFEAWLDTAEFEEHVGTFTRGDMERAYRAGYDQRADEE